MWRCLSHRQFSRSRRRGIRSGRSANRREWGAARRHLATGKKGDRYIFATRIPSTDRVPRFGDRLFCESDTLSGRETRSELFRYRRESSNFDCGRRSSEFPQDTEWLATRTRSHPSNKPLLEKMCTCSSPTPRVGTDAPTTTLVGPMNDQFSLTPARCARDQGARSEPFMSGNRHATVGGESANPNELTFGLRPVAYIAVSLKRGSFGRKGNRGDERQLAAGSCLRV